MPVTSKFTKKFELDTIGTLPASVSVIVFYSGGWVSIPDPKVAAGGPTGYTKVLQLPAIDAFYRAGIRFESVFPPSSDNYCNALILFKLLEPYSGTEMAFYFGNQLDVASSPNHIYASMASVNSSGTDYTGLYRFTNLQNDSPEFHTADSDTHAGLAFDTWYFIRYIQNGTSLSVAVWEAGTSEPSPQSAGTSDSSFSGYSLPVIYTRNRSAWEIAAVSVSFDSGTPPDAIPYGSTGDGAVEFSEALVEGGGAFSGDVTFEDFVLDGGGSNLGDILFPEITLAGESFAGGDGDIDFPEFGIHQANSGAGRIHADTRDIFDYAGRSGALGSVPFSTGLILATGSQLTRGNADTSFGTFTLDGEGNFSGAVSFEDAVIDASGLSFPVGRAGIDWSLSVGGTGKVGTVKAGSSPVSFPAFQVLGAGTVRIVGQAAMDFERFKVEGVALPGGAGDGVIILPSFAVLASGKSPPRGQGVIEFSIDLPSGGCHGHSDPHRHPILRFERHP